ncbi:MAG TPA: hypothetical protein VL178_05045 [Pseudomonas sp.]|jgi:hypothetical protein|nr:hypothetical protein [Pseudomonas sp.]
MQPLNDDELSAVAGQALISLDALTFGDYQYTRINFGAELDVLLNVDELRLGDFDRTGVPGLASNQSADILINNFALGRVRNNDSSAAAIEPFKIQDPYLEFAFKVNTQGIREVAGVRLGFGRSMGYLSGDILSLTGKMQGKIYGPASLGKDFYMEQNGISTLGCLVDIDCIALSLAGDTEVYTTVELVQAGTGNTTLDGVPINRATHIGVPAGNSLETDATGLVASLIPTLTKAANCEALGLITCFPLTNYKSIFVGDPTKTGMAQGGAEGIFFSIQNQNVPWQDLANVGQFVDTQRGAFANFAKSGSGANTIYPFMLTLFDALRGTPREPTCVGAQAVGC